MADVGRPFRPGTPHHDRHGADRAHRAVAAALWAALRTFGRIPGGRVVDEGDATLVFSETPYASFNNVIASSISDVDADRRIPELLRAFAPGSLPVTWWAGPMTGPADLVPRLQRLGLARQEPEFAMALDVAAGWPAVPLPAGASLEEVERPDQLQAWIGIMNAAYGWSDAAKASIMRSIYMADLALPPEVRDTHHFLVRVSGRPAACSSLFVSGGAAFVTNIGTHPEARGRGLGTAATVATLELARAMGRATATLAASVDGRSVYRRLGFVESGVLERYVATADTIAHLDKPVHRGDRR